MPKVLHVGCGPSTLRNLPTYFQDGMWEEIRLDIDNSVNPDIIGTITDMSAVKSGSVQAVYSSHNIEHIYSHEVPLALSEFKRVLSCDGFALITCPDLLSVARLVAEDKLTEPAYQSGMGPISPLDILYGHRASIEEGNHYMAHRSGFTLKTLLKALSDAGFSSAAGIQRPYAFDLWALGLIEPKPVEDIREQARRLFPGTTPSSHFSD